MEELSESVIKRFWAKVAKSDTCWLWTRPLKDNGYAILGMGGRRARNFYAHRASWMIHFGKIPDGLNVLHMCDVRHCVNPEHLFLGTQPDNMKDCSRKGRMHPGELNGGSKLTEDQALEIIDLMKRGMDPGVIAEQFCIHKNHVYSIAGGRKWKHLNSAKSRG